MKSRNIAWLASLLVAAAPFLASAEMPASVEPGKLTFGTAATLPPFEYSVQGKLTGFNIELVDAIAQHLKLQPEPLNMEFRGLIPALQGGRIDVIMNAMAITPERAAQIDFIPYLKMGTEILVRRGNPKKIAGRDDLCDRTVAVTLGGLQERYAREDSGKCTSAGKPALVVLTFPTALDSGTALRLGRADAMYDTTPGALQKVADLPDVFEIAGPTSSVITMGFGVRKGDAWKGRLEAALKAVVADGTYARLMAKYKLPPSTSYFPG
jgi:polar amino acid transport system substrate-binding protein